jgi:hypothetical protein
VEHSCKRACRYCENGATWWQYSARAKIPPIAYRNTRHNTYILRFADHVSFNCSPGFCACAVEPNASIATQLDKSEEEPIPDERNRRAANTEVLWKIQDESNGV